MSIRIIVNGASGRMGQQTVQAINDDPTLELVSSCRRGDDLSAAIQAEQPDVVVDFTTAEVAHDFAQLIIEHNVRPVIGTSGLTETQITALQTQCKDKQLGGVIAPNFSLGAVLMMQFAKQAARYLPDVEVVELHHPGKIDSPSGTAMKTAELIAESQPDLTARPSEKEATPGARGATHKGVHIHAIRLPGLIAHQQVLFGGHHETLSIRHDSLSRESFMPGVRLACKQVMQLNELVYGLEHLL